MDFALWRRVAPAALCTAALSVATFGVSAIANAEPREWDIEVYDNCLDSFDGTPSQDPDPQRWYDHVYWCCVHSGGVWQGSIAAGHCVAPPAEPAQVRPGLTPQPGTTLQPATPTSAPPPVGNLPTFAPSTG